MAAFVGITDIIDTTDKNIKITHNITEYGKESKGNDGRGEAHALYQLQTTLSGIDEKRALRGELPLEVEDLEDEIAGLETRIKNLSDEVESFRQAIVTKRDDIVRAKESLERYKAQINDVRNNREYDVLTKEIEFQNLEIQLCEKKIRDAQVKIEERTRDSERAKAQMDSRKADLDSKRAELDEIMEETRAEEEQLRERAEDLELRIEPRLLQSFKRIRKNARNGLGVVYVQRDACGGCFNKIPPQRQLDIKMHKKIIVCEYCGRILVDPELAGVKPVVTVDDKPKRKRATRTKTSAED